MKFPYSAILAPAADTGEEVLMFRPEIPLVVNGPNGSREYMALVDTGADSTIFPLPVAEDLGIATQEALGPAATAFGGQKLQLHFADVKLAISDEDQKLEWTARVFFVRSGPDGEETLLVGHQG